MRIIFRFHRADINVKYINSYESTLTIVKYNIHIAIINIAISVSMIFDQKKCDMTPEYKAKYWDGKIREKRTFHACSWKTYF